MNNALGTLDNIFVYIIYILMSIDQTLQKIDGPTVKSILCIGSIAAFILLFVQNRKLRALKKQLAEEEKWHKIACEDALTGLQNRRAYVSRINELETGKARGLSVHTVMIDIDHFKKINDTMGHQYGDMTLQRTAEYIQSVFQMNNCAVFRIGGDEFAVIATGMTDSQIKSRIEELTGNSIGKLGITLSVGFSKVDFENSKAMESAFEAADKKMYAYKIEHAV